MKLAKNVWILEGYGVEISAGVGTEMSARPIPKDFITAKTDTETDISAKISADTDTDTETDNFLSLFANNGQPKPGHTKCKSNVDWKTCKE